MSQQPRAAAAADGPRAKEIPPGVQRIMLVVSWTVVGVPLLYAIWQTAQAIGPLFAGG